MKLSFKTVLPIILISALLILLVGCFGVPSDESPGYTPGTITGIIAAPCCSTSADAVSAPQGVTPDYWCYYCDNTWSLQDGIKVVLTYGVDEVATTTTNEDGEYTFTNVPPGKNYVITALCPDYDDDRPLVKDVALEVVEGETYDAKITDCISTSLGLVVDYLVENTTVLGPEDIVLDGVIAGIPNFWGFPRFKKLVKEVCRVSENCGNLLEDEKVQDALCRAAEEIGRKVIPDLDLGCTPGYTGGGGGGSVVTATPAISVTKTANPQTYSSVGDVITYTIVVENTGDVTLTNIVVTDLKATITSGSPIVSLAPGATATVMASYTITHADLDAGSFKNTATATVGDVTGSADETVNAVTKAALTVTKAANPQTYSSVGDVITYTITVGNTGNVSITDLAVTDVNVGVVPGYVSGDTDVDGILDVGETWTYVATYEITQDDLDAGSVYNLATATGKDPEDNDVSDSDGVTVNAIVCSGETAWGGNYKGSGNAWWYYFDTNGPSTQYIYAGQQLTDGTVKYENGYLYIDLGSSMTLQGGSETVKVQGYHEGTLPIEKPSPGGFAYKGTALTISVDPYRYYAIHLDVQYCGPLPY